ncbi:MAG: biotin--[Treponema sp.]|nr:biotin--[acetyl-CoA-carboxylase] ligase [Treponema sp.]
MTTKGKILNLLEKQKDVISGQKLASFCNVSRAAVWKAVNSLRNEGINIEGTTNGGYVLRSRDTFNKKILEELVKTEYPELKDCTIEFFDEIDSTNSYAKRLLSEEGSIRNQSGELTEKGKKLNNMLIIASSQSNGRGRLGRSFISKSGNGIYFSLIYCPENGIQDAAKITAFSAVAVYRSIKELFNLDVKIKWINDIYADNKKICGILTEGFTNFETGTIESSVIGIGINIYDKIDSEIKSVAGSIQAALDSKNETITIDNVRSRLTLRIVSNLLKIFDEEYSKVIDEYRKASFLIGKKITVIPVIGQNKSYEAKVIDIDDNASLIVELEDRTRKTLVSGEISLHSNSFKQ